MNTVDQESAAWVAWWVGDVTHGIWQRYRLSRLKYRRVMANRCRARGVIAHDRVLNIEQTMNRGVTA